MTTSVDIKPSYLVAYGPTPNAPEPSETKSDYTSYYTKFQEMKAEAMKVPKTEALPPTTCCSRTNLLVPKTEVTCRSPTSMRPTYEAYMNQDSNSSSMSSMEAMNSRHHQIQPPPHQSLPGSYTMDDSRQHQMASHRSPYHQSPMSDEMYRPDPMRPYGEMSDSIARPAVTYPNEMVPRPYDNSLTSHRPYDPGTATAFERYDSSSQCGSLQQGIMPQRPQGMYGYAPMDDQQEQRYQQEVAAASQHHMAVSATSAGIMKAETEPPTGPIYPRYALFASFKFKSDYSKFADL